MLCQNCGSDQQCFDFKSGPSSAHLRPSPDLLLSTAVIEDVEKERSEESIEAIKAHLSQLEDHYARLEAEQAHCKEQRKNLLTLLEEHRAVAAPIRMLPDDVLDEIFMACVEDAFNSTHASKPHSYIHQLAALALSGVCKRWRVVALSTPRIWSRICVPFYTRHPISHLTVAKMTLTLRLYLERSAKSSLSIIMKVPPHFDNAFRANHRNSGATLGSIQLWMNTLVASAQRWQAINFRCSSSFLVTLQASIDSHPQISFAALEKADLDVGNEPIISAHRQLLTTARKLRQVNLGGSASAFNFPHSQLEMWRGILLFPSDIVRLLERSPNLTRCDVRMIDTSGSGSGILHIRHNLEVLRLELRPGVNDFREIFNSLTLPSLRKLYVSCSSRSHTCWDPDIFAQFLQRSSCSLQALVLDVDNFSTHEDLLQVLVNVPSLTKLECRENGSALEISPIPNILLERLVYEHASPSLSASFLPHLKYLSFMECSWNKLPSALIPMLDSRVNCPSPLESFHLELQHRMTMTGKGPGKATLSAKSVKRLKTIFANTRLNIVIIES